MSVGSGSVQMLSKNGEDVMVEGLDENDQLGEWCYVRIFLRMIGAIVGAMDSS